MAALEVMMEILLPFVTSRIIDQGLEKANLPVVYRLGAVMIVLAFFSLLFGALAGKFAASAASGFSANLREAIYRNIQTFSFSNIDKFSVPGLVTRMTTDITNVQNALMLIFSFIMCLYITNLINRFYDIADGKIRYDGININKIKKPDLRRSLGIVLQDTHLFTGTVMENIRYGKLDATDDECRAAARLAMPTASSAACPTAITPCSPATAPTSPRDSASFWPLHGQPLPTRRC